MGLELRPDGTLTGFATLNEALEARRRIIEQDLELRQAPNRQPDAALHDEATPLSETERKVGLAMLRAIADADGEISAGDLTAALGLKDSKAIGRYAIPARAVLSERLSSRQVTKVLTKRRDRTRGSIWSLDVAKVKEAGIVLP